ncbi:MAG: hypothetical protein GEV04_22185 [Actinophytocola sp.]|nr:hypothetical protein [Actinophytocola sp.]
MRRLAPDHAVASFDSASAMLRATARGIRGESFDHLGRGPVRALPVKLSAALPGLARRRGFAVAGGTEGVPPRRLGAVDMEDVAAWVVRHYDRDQYPGVLIGPPNGAAVHLCAATGMPFLAQTFLVPVQWSDNDPDHPADAMEFGGRVAGPLLDRNPDVMLHHMHDGNQDRLMVSRMTYFRLKWTALPHAYQRFLAERLAPDAPVVLLADESAWPTTRVGDRHVFQTGARGGLSPEEYVHGSARLAEFLHAQGSRHRRFQAPSPDGVSPEAEWGYDARIGADVRSVATETSHPVVTVRIQSPESLSEPTARLIRQRARDAGGDGDRLVVESFIMLDAARAERSGSVPYWSFFPVQDSLRGCTSFVERAAAAGDPYRDVDVLLFPHGVASVGATPPRSWAQRLRDHVSGTVRFVSGTAERWPAHIDTLGRYGRALRQLPSQPRPSSPLPVDEMRRGLSGDAVGVHPPVLEP